MRTTQIWVDGGGSGTRIRVLTQHGLTLDSANGGPSALAQGVEAAWRNIDQAIAATFTRAKLARPANIDIGLAIGVSGAEVDAWRMAFLAANPGYGKLCVATDGTTSLLGAHGGAPGAMIACGTGVIGEVLRLDGARVTVSGWGFPYGDEGSGAWLGQRALALTMHAIDGRLPNSPLTDSIRQYSGRDRASLLNWSFTAGQTGFAALAPLIFDAAATDPLADRLLNAAADELDTVARTLDPTQTLPIAMLGSVGQRIAHRMDSFQRGLHVPPKGTSLDGAFHLFEHTTEAWS